FRAEDVHLVARLGVAAEMADERQVDDRRRALGPEDVLELALPDVELVDAKARRMAFPVRPVDADQIERVREPARDQAALAAGDPGDEDGLPGLRAAARMEPRLGRGEGPLGHRRGRA